MTEETKTEHKPYTKAEREEYKTRVAELEAKVLAGEEAAMARVCKALDIEEPVIPVKVTEDQVEFFVPTPVRVNMTVYQGKVKTSLSTFHVIQQALGDRRMRLLRELTGNKYQLQELLQGGSAPKLIESVNSAGERIA